MCLIIDPRALNLWRRWWATDFQVPKQLFFRYLQIELNLYSWLPFFSLRFINFFSSILLLFYRSVYVFLTIAICIYLCFAEKLLFQFLTFGFISHTTRISNKANFLCKSLVVKYYLETIFPVLQNWNFFALDIQSQRIWISQ